MIKFNESMEGSVIDLFQGLDAKGGLNLWISRFRDHIEQMEAARIWEASICFVSLEWNWPRVTHIRP